MDTYKLEILGLAQTRWVESVDEQLQSGHYFMFSGNNAERVNGLGIMISSHPIWTALKNVGVPEKIIALIRELYQDADCSVLFKGTKSNKFQVDRGIRQGWVLSSLLFVVVFDRVLHKTNTDAPGGMQWRPHQKLSDLDYVDDMCFLAHRLPELKNTLDALIENAKQVGLRVNFKKTKLMRVETLNQNAHSTICNNSEEIIEDVEQFCYLGSVITKMVALKRMLTRVSTRSDMLFIGLIAFRQHIRSASKPNCVF